MNNMDNSLATVSGREKKKVFFACAVYYCVLLFIISPDSVTHDLNMRIDESIFFMAGKAWMNGLVPYVDFADSKGPLLWLIYGIGYLLSSKNYLGIFLINCLMYSVMGYYVFKTINIYNRDLRKCFVGTVLMSVPFFFVWYTQYVVEAEEYCMIFVVISIYVTAILLESNEGGCFNKKNRIRPGALLYRSFSHQVQYGGNAIVLSSLSDGYAFPSWKI